MTFPGVVLPLLVGTRFQVLSSLKGVLSPFPHGTGSLSVRNEYLALRDGPRGFKQGFSCPALLRYLLRVWMFRLRSVTSMDLLSRRFANNQIGNSTLQAYNPRRTEMQRVWAVPISLATTFGIEVSFFSWRY